MNPTPEWNKLTEFLVAVGLEPDSPGAGEPVRYFAVVPRPSGQGALDTETFLGLLAHALAGRLARTGASQRDERGTDGDLDLRFSCESTEAASVAAEDFLIEAAGAAARVWEVGGEFAAGAVIPFLSTIPVHVDASTDPKIDSEHRQDGPLLTTAVMARMVNQIPSWAFRWPGDTIGALALTISMKIAKDLNLGDPPAWVVRFNPSHVEIRFLVSVESLGEVSSWLKNLVKF